MPSHASRPSSSPVFVDPRGRRRRWAVLAAWTAAAVAALYLALVMSALLGGPTIRSPFLPAPIVADAPVVEPLPAPVGTQGPADAEDDDAPSMDASRVTTPPSPEPTAPTTDPTAPEPPSPTEEPTAPGNSGDAPGRTTSTTTPGSDNRTTPDPAGPERRQP